MDPPAAQALRVALEYAAAHGITREAIVEDINAHCYRAYMSEALL
jgi:hypothetical protein